jgi:hypothetical protein
MATAWLVYLVTRPTRDPTKCKLPQCGFDWWECFFAALGSRAASLVCGEITQEVISRIHSAWLFKRTAGSKVLVIGGITPEDLTTPDARIMRHLAPYVRQAYLHPGRCTINCNRVWGNPSCYWKSDAASLLGKAAGCF